MKGSLRYIFRQKLIFWTIFYQRDHCALEGIEAITKAPSDYFLLLKEQDGTLQSNEANTGVFVKTRSLQKLQRKMTVLYEKQKEKGALVQNNFSS